MNEVVTNYELLKKVHSAKKEYRHDRFGRATRMLVKLSYLLQNIGIETNNELLLDLKEGKKNYKVIKKGFPRIVVSRQLVVPVYTYGYNVTSEKMTEEHTMLSKRYILSKYKK